MCSLLMRLEGKCCLRESSQPKEKRKGCSHEAGSFPRAILPHHLQRVLVMFLILQLLKWPILIPGAILMGCKTLGTCVLPSNTWTLLSDLCPNKLIYVFSQCVPTIGFLFASIPAHNNSIESQASVHICTKFSNVPKQLNWGSLSRQFFIYLAYIYLFIGLIDFFFFVGSLFICLF